MGERDLPRIDFATFLVSLGTSVQIHLGLLADPHTGKTEVRLTEAQQTIDILEMLEEKTRNNLSKEEGNLLRHLLYELRVSFVAQKEKQSK